MGRDRTTPLPSCIGKKSKLTDAKGHKGPENETGAIGFLFSHPSFTPMAEKGDPTRHPKPCLARYGSIRNLAQKFWKKNKTGGVISSVGIALTAFFHPSRTPIFKKDETAIGNQQKDLLLSEI